MSVHENTAQGANLTNKRLAILQASLIKKQSLFDEKLSAHFSCVKEANGQPLNDKSGGRATLNSWDRQNDALRTLSESIKKTASAIEKEERKMSDVDCANESTPVEILKLVAEGALNQWRKHPNTFFVAGVDKARIVWDEKTLTIGHRYVSEISDKDQHRKFATLYNALRADLATGKWAL